MVWNHRVVNMGAGYQIAEVYYEDDKVTPMGWSADPVAPYGETLGDLRVELNRMLAALDKPVLKEFTGHDGKPELREIF